MTQSRRPQPHHTFLERAAEMSDRRRKAGDPRGVDVTGTFERQLAMGARAADGFARAVGSWRFIIVQSLILVAWIIVNVTAWARQWDPYPFILLNLMLSFQAAYAAPIIMMSQNRAGELDRVRAKADYEVNQKAEAEIEEIIALLRGHLELSELMRREITPQGS